MAKKGRPKTSNRKSFHTTIDPSTIKEAKLALRMLEYKNIKKDGLNQLIEEGLELVMKKYEDEINSAKRELLQNMEV